MDALHKEYGASRLRLTVAIVFVIITAVTSVLSANYDYPPTHYTAQEQIPSGASKVFTDAEETTHYWGATNHKLVMRFVPEPRGYMGAVFRLRGIINSGFKLRQINLELPRTDAFYWPGDSDIVSAEVLFRRRRLQAVVAAEGDPPIAGRSDRLHKRSADLEVTGQVSPVDGSSNVSTSASLLLSSMASPVGTSPLSYLFAFAPSSVFFPASAVSSSSSSQTIPLASSSASSSKFNFLAPLSQAATLDFSPFTSAAPPRSSTSSTSPSLSSPQSSSATASGASSSLPRPSQVSKTSSANTPHPLWSAFPVHSPPKVVRHALGTHSLKNAAHIPLHPRQHARRLDACEPLPPNTKHIVKEIFAKHGVNTDGIFVDDEASTSVSSITEGKMPFSSAVEVFKETPDTQAFDAIVDIPDILPPYHPQCPANTACGAEYCLVYGCEAEKARKGPASMAGAAKKLLWIPPKEIQLVVHVDVPASATSMQEQWMLQILEKPLEASQLKPYPGYEDVYNMGYNVGDVVKKKTNELFFKYLPPLRNPLRVEQIRLDNGAGLGSLNYTFTALVTPERQRIYVYAYTFTKTDKSYRLTSTWDIHTFGGRHDDSEIEMVYVSYVQSTVSLLDWFRGPFSTLYQFFSAAEVNPQLHLTLPGPACSTAETAWVEPFGSRPIWLANTKLRNCWDLFQACETLHNGGLFDTCEVAYEKLRDGDPVARKIILSGATRDIPARPFTLKFSGLYPPNTNLTNSVPLWYMQVASGYPKTLKQKEERAKLDETYSKILEGLYEAGDCIGWTFRPFIDKRLRDQKPKISHQSYFYTPQLALLPTIVRGTPSDSFPFFLNLTFSVNTLAKGSTIEFAFPHVLLPRDGFIGGAGALQRYDPFTREFLTTPPPELVARTDENDRMKVQISSFDLKRQIPVSIYLPVPALPRYGEISPVWAASNSLSMSSLSKNGFSLVVKDQRNKELLSTFLFPTPILRRRAIGGVVGPEFQLWNAEKQEEMALFKIFFDTELAKSSIRLILEVLGNSPNAVEGILLNRKDPNACTAILRGPTELLVHVSCPQAVKEVYQIDISTANGERSFPVGWYVLGVIPQASTTEIAWFGLKVLNAMKKTVFQTSLLADRSKRSVQQQPCLNRFITKTVKHPHTGYTSNIKFIFQLYNCFYPAQPMRPMPQQREPLEARVPKDDGWPSQEYFSSVQVYRRTERRQVPTSRGGPLQTAMYRYISKTRAACAVDSRGAKCSAAKSGFETLEQLDPPHYLDLLKEPDFLVASPSLAAASVLFNFPKAEQAGILRPPPIRHDAPAHRNPMSMHVKGSTRTARMQDEEGVEGEMDKAAAESEQIKITAHILLDELHLNEKAINAFKRFVALKVEDESKPTLCIKESGVLCYFYSNKNDKNVVAWRNGAVIEKPKLDKITLPEEELARDVFDQITTLLHYAQDQRRKGWKVGLMNWTIVVTHRDLSEAYEKQISASSSSSEEAHTTTTSPEHVLVLGWTSEESEQKRSVQQQLQELPFSPIRQVLLGSTRDVQLQQIVQEPVFINFLSAEPTEYLRAHVLLLRYLEEVLYLIQEEYIKSFVVLDICRHPLPPKGYTYGDSVNTRATAEELERPVELLFNGIPFTTLKWKIPASEVGVYTAAKLSWQFDMACEGVLAQQHA